MSVSTRPLSMMMTLLFFARIISDTLWEMCLTRKITPGAAAACSAMESMMRIVLSLGSVITSAQGAVSRASRSNASLSAVTISTPVRAHCSRRLSLHRAKLPSFMLHPLLWASTLTSPPPARRPRRARSPRRRTRRAGCRHHDWILCSSLWGRGMRTTTGGAPRRPP